MPMSMPHLDSNVETCIRYKNPKHLYSICCLSHFLPHWHTLPDVLPSRKGKTKMSELTERSKCVFQAKLAEQAERYDGRFRKPKRVVVVTGDDWIRDPI